MVFFPSYGPAKRNIVAKLEDLQATHSPFYLVTKSWGLKRQCHLFVLLI